MRRYRIILADDHPLVRQGIKRILDESPDLQVVGEAASGQETLELVEKLRPDLAIIDIQMPRLNGLEAARRIRERWPDVKVLVLTMHKEAEYLQRSREIGAEGFLLKEDVDQVLYAAIAAIRRGQTFVSPLMDT